MKICRFLITVFILLAISQRVLAGNPEGTMTYKDYIFVLVHGLNSDGNIFTKYSLKEFIERPVTNDGLGLKGRVFAYSFNDPADDYMSKARELGDRSYKELPPEMNGKCWLEKAKEDFIKENPNKPVPEKYILIAHSAGNLAARAYIYSNRFEFRGLMGGSVHTKEAGFYENDVDKIVFVAAPFTGTGAAFLYSQAWWDFAPYFGTKTDRWIFGSGDLQTKFNQLKQPLLEVFDINEIWNMLDGNPSSPWSPYISAANFAGASVLGFSFIANLYSPGGYEAKITVPWSPGMTQLLPSNAAALSASAAWTSSSGLEGLKYIPDKDPNKVPESVIPQKYILIAHSMGGLVARTYLSSDYYNNDVAAIITIDSQHLGSDGAQAPLERMA